MGLFAKFKKVEAADAESDSLGGGFLFDTGLVDFKIEAAFITLAASGAGMFNLHLVDPITKKVMKISECVLTKAGTNFYIDKKTGEERPLIGYNKMNAICQLAADREIHTFDDEDPDDVSKKTVKMWKDKKEQNVQVDMLMPLIGAPITIGVLRQIVDKTAKNDKGDYVPTGETREENAIGKSFHTETGFTLQEIIAGATEEDTPEFRVKWLEANTKDGVGVTKNLAKGTAGGAKAGAPATAKKSGGLFANKDAG